MVRADVLMLSQSLYRRAYFIAEQRKFQGAWSVGKRMLRRVGVISLSAVLAVCAFYEVTKSGKVSARKPLVHSPATEGNAVSATPVDERSSNRAEPTPDLAKRPVVAQNAASPLAAQISEPSALAQWSHDSPCDPRLSAEAARVREQIRLRFTRVAAPPGNASLYFDPSVRDAVVQRLLYALARIERLVHARLGLSSIAPDVYLYRSPTELRKGACVSPKTVSYYDGAIHLYLDPDDDLLNSLKHEYVHHALFSHAIRRPVWFQEGVAMLIGSETEWLRWRPKGPLLPPERMVQTFPQAASAEEAEAFYGQAFAMTVFLNKLCENDASCDLRDLVRALETGVVRPETLFDWAVSQRGTDLVRTARLPLWDDYIANGLQFGPDTTTAIWARRWQRR